jgi:16S rRNA (cytosine1402-N4)-methyltransferase
MSAPHIPVLLTPVIEHLAPRDGELFIDGTFGAGGYSTAILEAADVRVLAFDRDPTAVEAAVSVCQRFPNRLCVINAPFGRMEEFTRIEETPNGQPLVEGPLVDGIVLDLGVSSMQIDQPDRGFSFQNDGPLDMRMSQAGDHAGRSAADLVNTLTEEKIANILFTYGDERKSRSIARAIVRRRAVEPFARTLDLASVIARVLGPRKADGRHQATRSFQALRIAVNDELGELARALVAAERLLKPGGRLVIVTFHSLEDRLVKRFLIERAGKQSAGSRYLPEIVAAAPPSFQIINQRPVSPTDEECAANPRARSAKLRAALRTPAAPWPQGASTDMPLVEF